jgi:4-hydroxybenzoyl-CoA thioesterase
MLWFSRRVTIEWQHCDPAGIVFYPRYFAMFDTSTTMLFEHALGMTKYQLLKTYDFLGYPMVETRTRFTLPTRFGDEIEIKTSLIEVKHSSFTVEHQILKAGQLAVEGRDTRVWVVTDPANPDKFKSMPIPPEVIAKLTAEA